MKHFFRRIQVDTYAQMHTRVKLLGGMQDVDHTQTIAVLEGYRLIIGGDMSPQVLAPLLGGSKAEQSELLLKTKSPKTVYISLQLKIHI